MLILKYYHMHLKLAMNVNKIKSNILNIKKIKKLNPSKHLKKMLHWQNDDNNKHPPTNTITKEAEKIPLHFFKNPKIQVQKVIQTKLFLLFFLLPLSSPSHYSRVAFKMAVKLPIVLNSLPFWSFWKPSPLPFFSLRTTPPERKKSLLPLKENRKAKKEK